MYLRAAPAQEKEGELQFALTKTSHDVEELEVRAGVARPSPRLRATHSAPLCPPRQRLACLTAPTLPRVCCVRLVAQLFLNESVEAATEGLIVKTLNDTYEPAKRSSHWLKVGAPAWGVADQGVNHVRRGCKLCCRA